MRKTININNDWFYKPSFEQTDIKSFNKSDYENARLPHTNKMLPVNYFKTTDYAFVSCYKKILSVAKEYHDQYVYLHFEGVMTACEVFLNGEKVGENKGGYTDFNIHLPKNLLKEENELTVMVDSTEREEIPPFGNSIDYLTFGGIYREVQLNIVPHVHMNKAWLTPKKQLEDVKELGVLVEILNAKGAKDEVTIEVSNKDLKINESQSFTLNGSELQSLEFNISSIKNAKLWDLDNPNLYEFDVILKDLDTKQVKIGFRKAEFTAKGFFLNDQHVKIVGLNRHQSYPHVGYAMPARVQKKDADILKEFGCNLARTSHYPQSRHFLDRCDEIGLLVFEEIPGWQHIGDANWKDLACDHVSNMINRDYNHPSIILWGVRVNESKDDHDFYVKTNEIAHNLDKSRQTGGVRYHNHSEFLEDVFTINDFTHQGHNRGLKGQRESTGLEYDVPYMVTEYIGAGYPVKKFDNEDLQIERARRELIVLNDGMSVDNVAGLISWCAFDYQTHYNFGAGDQVCYHGLFDMYRLPKWSAFVYKSQQEKEIVLEPMTVWAMGERCGPLSEIDVLTNCDYVEFHKDGKLFGKYYSNREQHTTPDDKFVSKHYPNTTDYKHLPHPPVRITEVSKKEEWGFDWHDCEFVGYKDNKEVIRRKRPANAYMHDFSVKADDDQLIAGDFDATRVIIRVKDQFENKLSYFNGSAMVSVDGVGKLIGDKYLSLIGGEIAFWVENTNEKGDIKIKVTLLNNTEVTKELTIKSV